MTYEEKLQRYNDYFSLDYAIKLNITPFKVDETVPDKNGFLAEMPYPFRLATEVTDIDGNGLSSMRNLGSGTDQLISYLTNQARKIDLIMSYILSQEDEEDKRFISEQFSAGGFIVSYPSALMVGSQLRLKLFLTIEASAVYCFGEVLTCEATDNGQYRIQIVYSQIREDDREILVRAALREQSRQLRALKQQRTEQAE